MNANEKVRADEVRVGDVIRLSPKASAKVTAIDVEPTNQLNIHTDHAPGHAFRCATYSKQTVYRTA